MILAVLTLMLVWDAPLLEEQVSEYTLYVNNQSVGVLADVVCDVTMCQAPLPENVPLTIGTSLELTAMNDAGESPKSVPLLLGSNCSVGAPYWIGPWEYPQYPRLVYRFTVEYCLLW